MTEIFSNDHRFEGTIFFQQDKINMNCDLYKSICRLKVELGYSIKLKFSHLFLVLMFLLYLYNCFYLEEYFKINAIKPTETAVTVNNAVPLK